MTLTSSFFLLGNASAQEPTNYQRLVKIVVDPAQLDAFKTALKKGTESSVRLEAGVLSYQMYAEKEKPNHIILLETYASVDAYNQHIQTPHFNGYKAAVADMVQSLEIVDVMQMALVTRGEH